MEKANKLIGTGKKHLVMGKVVEAVSTLQEASGMLWVTLKSRWSFSEVERETVPQRAHKVARVVTFKTLTWAS